MNMHTGKQQRTPYRRTGNDASAGDKRGHCLAAPAIPIVNELRRRRDFSVGPDRPGAVVEVELRQDIGEINIRRPIGIQRSYVPPIAKLTVSSDARATEMMSYAASMVHAVRDDILAEVMTRTCSFLVPPTPFTHQFRT